MTCEQTRQAVQELLTHNGYLVESVGSPEDFRNRLTRLPQTDLLLADAELLEGVQSPVPVVVLVPPGDAPLPKGAAYRAYVPTDPLNGAALAATVETVLAGEGDGDLSFEFFFENVPVAAIISDQDFLIEHWNRGAADLFGYSRTEAVGRNLVELLASEKNEFSWEQLKGTLQKTLQENRKSVNINYDRTREGRDILCEWYDFPYRSGRRNCILSVAQDITKDQELLDSLQRAVEQKDFLMQEIYHRLKNNLNMIVSLIALKIDEVEVRRGMGPETDAAVEAMQDVRRKISAFSVLYEMLYQHKGDAAHLDLRWYLEEILATVFASMTGEPCRTEYEMDSLVVPPETAVVLGLITNEIATNAIKHGFVAGDPRRFSVTLRKSDEAGMCRLVMENSGAPFPEDVDFDTTASLGLQLIQTLVQQLEGTVNLRRTPSAQYTIRFPLS